MADNIGDNIDLGGKLPQFKAFASIAYNELNANRLVWIRIADPKAMILDDIQYATKTEVHAYQVKWSNKDEPQTFSYLNLQELLKDIIGSWQKLRIDYAGEHKPFLVHLLTNREPSAHDHIKETGGTRVGSFSGFIEEVWMKLKTKNAIDTKWQKIASEFEASTGLAKSEFDDFVAAFDMQFCYPEIDFGTDRIEKGKQNQDLLDFTMFLLEKVADKARKVPFDAAEIIKGLNWEPRFKTIFNHELAVDPSRYSPIKETVEALNEKVDNSNGGYVFLSGGPGSGKSSLLAQWSKTRKEERVVHYFAFDFTDPASGSNTHDRGDATNLLYDLVLQLKEHGLWESSTVMHKDKDFLRKTFTQQLNLAKREFADTKRKTIIVIDGLDHVPREYRLAVQSLIGELPSPADLSEGVIVVLGSQTYNLTDLPHSVKTAFDKKDKNVEMSPMSKHEVGWYIDHSKTSVSITAAEREKLFEISQGHPLYLSYLINKIDEGGTTEFLNDEVPLEANIEDYYARCWRPIKEDAKLVEFLGLVARINGDIHTSFIKQWPFSYEIQSNFSKQTSYLFQKDATGWHFFHNSFRQFLITQTAIDPFDEKFDEKRHHAYHQTLAKYYAEFDTPTPWQKLYHYFMGGQEPEFIEAATQQSFFEQYGGFRPDEEIENDILLGVKLAKKLHDPYLLGRYIFALNELNSRTQVIGPNSFIEEFIQIGKIELAKQLMRNNRKLLVNIRYALKAVHWFYGIGEIAEAKLIFALAEPLEVSMDGIRVQQIGYDRDNVKSLKNWASAAILFSTAEDFLKKIEQIVLLDQDGEEINSNKLRNSLLSHAATSLINNNRENELEALLKEIREDDYVYTRRILWQATLHFHELGNDQQARMYLQRFLDISKGLVLGDFEKVELANMVYTVTKNVTDVAKMIEDVGQPSAVDYNSMNGDKDLAEFSERLLFNKMLNLAGKGQSILEAVPNPRKVDQMPVVEFERNICLIVKLYTDGVQGVPLIGDLKVKLSPIIRFFYGRDQRSDHKLYKLKLGASTYFKWLIDAVAVYGTSKVEELMRIFEQEFREHPETWSVEVIRFIYLNGYRHGADQPRITEQLKELENTMLDGLDPSGRADQCHLQAEAWIELGEYEPAEKCMHMGLEASLGIGYRKDSQYRIWVEWLDRILQKEPAKAEERIRMFALHLPLLKETAERSQSREGAEELLKATLQYNLAWGLQLLTWLLEQGLIELFEGMGATLKTLAEKAKEETEVRLVLDLYKELYLTIATRFDEDLLQALLNKAQSLLPDFEGIELTKLVTAVRINTLPKTRDSYYQCIKSFLEGRGHDTTVLQGLTDLSATTAIKKRSSNNLTLHDPYETLSEAEVIEKVKDGPSFVELFAKESKANSYFSWDRVFVDIQHTLTEKDLSEIFKHCTAGNRDSELLAKMTDKALDLGDKVLAKAFANASLLRSSTSGWIAGYDGGSRLSACKALVATDPENGFDRSLEVLADDVMGSDYVSEFHKALDEILPVITKEPDDQKMWPEIESFLSRLLIAEPSAVIPPFKNGNNELVSGDLMLLLCGFANKRMRGIIATVFARNLAGSANLQSTFRTLASGKYDEQSLFLETLGLGESVGLSEIFAAELQLLAVSDNLFIRRDAVTLLEKLADQTIPLPKEKVLPKIYELELPVSKGFNKPESLPGDKVVKDTENLHDLIGSYSDWLPLIAGQTGFEEGAILQRWGQLMKEDGMDKTTTEYEEKVRAHRNAVELEFHFPRPRFQVVTQSLGRLIAELKDAGALEDGDFPDWYGVYDYTLQAKLKVTPRPEWIIPMHEGKLFLSGWVNDISSSARLHTKADRTSDGWIIAGEQTELLHLGWGKPTETITTYMVLGGSLPHENDNPPIAHLSNCLMDEYHERLDAEANNYITVFNTQDFRNPGKVAEWIAFNPVLARQLGWKPNSAEMFAWEDEEGNLMAFSRYWRDGNIEMSVPKHDNEVGEGWYTLISEKALAQLKNIQTPFFTLKRRITRELFYEGYQTDTFDQMLDEWE